MIVSCVYFYVICGLCDGLITRLEVSYRLFACVCLGVCDLEISTMRRPRPEVGCGTTANKKLNTGTTSTIRLLEAIIRFPPLESHILSH